MFTQKLNYLAKIYYDYIIPKPLSYYTITNTAFAFAIARLVLNH